jgi:hypothetical protein
MLIKKYYFVSYYAEYDIVDKSDQQHILRNMNRLNLAVMLVLSAGLLTTLGGYAVPVFANGDEHNDDDNGKKCKHNDDNNCNSAHIDQDVYTKNYCEIENESEDHSHDNLNENTLGCENRAENTIGDFSISDLLNLLT